jgi:hypothetical protein
MELSPQGSLSICLMQVPPIVDERAFSAKFRRLLDVSDVADWLGVSKGWVRDHASGRRQPRLLAIKPGPAQRKGSVEVW